MRNVTMVICVLCLAGCSTKTIITEGTHPPVRVDSPNTTIRWDSASLLDDSIQGKIAVEGIGSERTATGTLSVWAILRNRTDYPQTLEARVSFYGQDFAPIEPTMAWQRVHLTANGFENYRGLSQRTEASHFYIEVREAR